MKYKAIKRVLKDISNEWYLDFKGFIFEEQFIFSDKHIDNISKEQLQDIKTDLIWLTGVEGLQDWIKDNDRQIEDKERYVYYLPKLNHLLKML